MVNITSFLEPKIITLVVALLVLVIIVIVLFIVQKKLKKKIINKESIEEGELLTITEIRKLKSSRESPESTLHSLNKIVRNFLKAEFEISKGTDYGEMISDFNKKGKRNLSDFCRKMLEALYSGEKMQRREVSTLLNKFEKILSEQHPNILIKKPIKIQEVVEEPVKPPVIKEIPRAFVVEEPPEKAVKEGKKSVLIIPKNPKFSLGQSKEDTIIELHKIDEEQIIDAYKKLQYLFEITYNVLEKKKDKNNMMRLKEFKKIMMEKMQKYLTDPGKDREFTGEISAGVKFLKALVR